MEILGKCLIKCHRYQVQSPPSTHLPLYQIHQRRADGCCGNLTLRGSQACQELTDHFFSARNQAPYLDLRNRSECIAVKHRWNFHTPVLAMILIDFPCLGCFAVPLKHLKYNGGSCIRETMADKHLWRAPLCFIFHIHSGNTGILMSSAQMMLMASSHKPSKIPNSDSI